jgi:hypothetical protein
MKARILLLFLPPALPGWATADTREAVSMLPMMQAHLRDHLLAVSESNAWPAMPAIGW